MDKKRRKRIREVVGKLKQCRATTATTLRECREELRDLKDEEQDAFDNVPENLQEQDQWQESETIIDNLDSAIEDIDEAIKEIEDI